MSLDKSLSNSDIEKFLNKNGYSTRILRYNELGEFNNIDELFVDRSCVILFETRANYGHWVCLLKHLDGSIEFFDSYGYYPDDELRIIPDYFRIESGQEFPHLTYLLYKFSMNRNNKIIYNQYRLQEKKKDINTCGRWVCCRILMKDTTCDEFARLFRTTKEVSGDELVSTLTKNT